MFRQDDDSMSPVDKIMKKPDKLHDLDLDAFAVELQRRVCNTLTSYFSVLYMYTLYLYESCITACIQIIIY